MQFMDFKTFFSPQVVKDFKSKLNTQIQIVNYGGRLRLDMGGLIQSGRLIESIWNTGFKKLLSKDFSPNKVLILGFGAGSVASLIHRKWPQALITGIEIDPVVIKIATDYFKAKQIPGLEVINADAFDYVSKLKSDYDLVIVDCYLGDQVPKKLQSLSFFKKLKKHSSVILINRLFWDDYKRVSLKFLDLLDHHFTTKTIRTSSNFLISIT